MSADATAFSFTCKISGDLFTIRGNSGDEFAKNLVWTTDNIEKLLEQFVALQAVGNATALVAPQKPAPAPAPQQAWGQGPSVPPQPVPSQVGPVCDHGELAKHIPAGISKKTGRPYKGFYACARPQADQCSFRLSE